MIFQPFSPLQRHRTFSRKNVIWPLNLFLAFHSLFNRPTDLQTYRPTDLQTYRPTDCKATWNSISGLRFLRFSTAQYYRKIQKNSTLRGPLKPLGTPCNIQFRGHVRSLRCCSAPCYRKTHQNSAPQGPLQPLGTP